MTNVPRSWMSPAIIALAGAVSLAVAIGIGRLAFTPLLPMMLYDQTIGLAAGSSWLASRNDQHLHLRPTEQKRDRTNDRRIA